MLIPNEYYSNSCPLFMVKEEKKSGKTYITPLSVYTNGKPLSYSPCGNCCLTRTLSYCVILCHSVVFITCTRLFPLSPSPPSDIMGQSKVTHIYPIIRGFEKTHIELQLMLQWGPESERCYRPKRLGFQGPANKRQSSPQREREKDGMMGWEGVVGERECTQ